ncbi:MAG: zinc-binding dehydrogenase, partial [Acholeplasmataceae bacterium]
VSAETHIVCGTCEFCQRGEYHICENTKIIGVDTDGCFAEYAKMPAYNLIVNHSAVDPKYLSVQEPLGNAMHTMMHFEIKDKTVAVVGCGPIGLMGVNIAKAAGSKKIIAIEINDYRINLAKKLGAHVVINPLKEDVIKRVLEETDGKGVDVVTEFSGNKTAIEQSFKYIKPGGKMSMLGIGEQNIDIDFSNDIVFKGIEIYGVIGRRMFETWDQVTLFVQSGKLDLDVIVTHIFKLEEMEKGIQQMISGNSGKVVLIP